MDKTKALEDLVEVINLDAIQHLPKPTEHFISDLHGEYDAFEHILRNGSGRIREKVDYLFKRQLRYEEISELCFIIYYPEEVLTEVDYDEQQWFVLMERLVKVARFSAGKYTRSKVRKALPKDFAYIIEELLYQYDQEYEKEWYYGSIFNKIIELDLAQKFCEILGHLIQRLVVDHLHVLGDIYDRGPAPDKIMDSLMTLPSLDIQLGNHDILWIGAFCGSLGCLTNLLRISARYGNLELLEQYGIDLAPLKKFAKKNYQENAAFAPKIEPGEMSATDCKDAMRLQQALAIMQFKVEGTIIKRRPEFQLEERLLLDKLTSDQTELNYQGTKIPLVNGCFQLVGQDAYQLTDEEEIVLTGLLQDFQNSERLQKHIAFLVEKGTLYLRYNGNLLFHGCLPCDQQGELLSYQFGGQMYQGVELLDFYLESIRTSFKNPQEHDDLATDIIWYLWCGAGSTLFGKKAMKTFERYFIADKKLHTEEKNAYYQLREKAAFCENILRAFGLSENGHIINGHTPVKVVKGDIPIKADGRLLVIDGGLSKPYQKVTGIAGYTLVANSFGMTLVAHQPFTNRQEAIKNRQDILSQKEIVVRKNQRLYVKDTDIGEELARQIDDLLR
ncbi:fructose-1,6-bisphosphatase [Enterococcus sp. LJL90]